MTHTTIDYRDKPNAEFVALNDCINWLGWTAFERACLAIVKDDTSTTDQLVNIMSIGGIRGFPARVMVDFALSLRELDNEDH